MHLLETPVFELLIVPHLPTHLTDVTSSQWKLIGASLLVLNGKHNLVFSPYLHQAYFTWAININCSLDFNI